MTGSEIRSSFQAFACVREYLTQVGRPSGGPLVNAAHCPIRRDVCAVSEQPWQARLRGRGAHIAMTIAALVLIAQAAFGQDAMQGYYGIRPGVSTKAQVDLSIGEPIRKLSADGAVFEYPPMKDDAFSRRLVIKYESDTSEVARLDAYLKAPLVLAEIRNRFGTRVISRDREDGGREEVYYPQLQALVFSSKSADAPVTAISHLSPRTMGGIYVGRFEEMVARKSFDEARTEADKAVVVDPDGGEGYLAQGRYFALQQNYNEALVRFTAASNAKYSAADKYQAHLEIARAHEATSAFDNAHAAYRRAIEAAAPADRSDAHFRYGRFLNGQKKVDEAFAQFNKAVELNPQHSAARRALGDVYFARKDYTRALPHFEALSQEAEKMSDGDKGGTLHFYYAFCLAHFGKDAQAIVEYEKALQLSGPRAATLNNLGLLYVKTGNHSKALEAYRAGLAIEPKDALLNRHLAEALLEAGQLEEARRQAERTVSLNDDDARAAFTLARCWGALKKKKETLQWLHRAVGAGFSDREALTTDRFLGRIQDDGGFKKLLLQVR